MKLMKKNINKFEEKFLIENSDDEDDVNEEKQQTIIDQIETNLVILGRRIYI